MSVAKLAGRYAKSLIDLAQEQGKLQTILGDIQAFKAANGNRDMYLMLKSPIINAAKKRSIIQAIFGESFDEMTMAFTKIVLTKGREEFLPEICDEFINQYRAIKNITSATVISATPLKEETLEKIKDKIRSEMTQGGGTVEIETKVDASLLGGFVIEVGHSLYDASVATRLNKLKKELTSNVN
jgi:F-type H+-transporting ATPase subunit delta